MIEWICAGCLAILAAVANQAPVFVGWFNQPPHTVFTASIQYWADYFLYTAQMAEGAAGQLWYTQRFTGEPLPPTWMYWFNNVLGWLGHLVGLSPFAVYNTALFLLVSCSLVLVFLVLCRSFPDDPAARIGGFLLYLIGSPLPDLSVLLNQHRLLFPDDLWFSPAPVFNRLGGVPHQVWQTILFLLLSIMFIKALKLTSRNSSAAPKTYLLLAAISMLAASANPLPILVFLPAAAVTGLWSAFRHTSGYKPALTALLITGLAALPAAWLINREFSSPIFAAAKVWELRQYVNTGFRHFLVSLGPLTLFLPFGLFALVRTKSTTAVLFSATAIVSAAFFLSPLPRLLGTVPSRYQFPAGYAGLTILALLGMQKLSRTLRTVVEKIRLGPGNLFLILFLAGALILDLPGSIADFSARLTPAGDPVLLAGSLYAYVPNPVAGALTWLKGQPDNPLRPVVMVDSGMPIEIMVPVFTDKTVFNGHPIHTLHPDEKERLRQMFFSRSLRSSDAEAFLQQNRIGYIIAGTLQGFPLYAQNLPFLSKIYKNAMITIYQVTSPVPGIEKP